jgi:hypothetical protein
MRQHGRSWLMRIDQTGDGSRRCHEHPIADMTRSRHNLSFPRFERVPKAEIDSIERQNWVFHGDILGQKGALQPIRLFKTKSIAIERHVKIQSAANPYDPEWETYFEKRLDVKMAHNLKGKRQLLHLCHLVGWLPTFINEEVVAYGVREQITFTRGRPYEKRDQCFIELSVRKRHVFSWLGPRVKAIAMYAET